MAGPDVATGGGCPCGSRWRVAISCILTRYRCSSAPYELRWLFRKRSSEKEPWGQIAYNKLYLADVYQFPDRVASACTKGDGQAIQTVCQWREVLCLPTLDIHGQKISFAPSLA
jgi:hypothetical protein